LSKKLGRVGPPTKREASGFDGYPLEEWRTPPVTIYHSIFERFGEYHVFRIQHRGKIGH